ncbi:MAG: Ig-like domain-containing protein [Planctomycetota bacterium]
MKFFENSKISLVLLGFVVGLVLCGGQRANAHLIDPCDFNQEDLRNLQTALGNDKTDDNNYKQKSYNCYHFARNLQYNLWKNHNIESLRTNIKYRKNGKDKEEEHNEVKVTIRDIDGNQREVHIEPQDDQIFTDVNNLLLHLQPTQTIDWTETSDNHVLIPIVRVYVDGKDTHGSLPASVKEKQQFTVKVTVVDAQRRPAKDQKVTIKIKHADGSEDTLEGVTDKNGEVTREHKTDVKMQDILEGKDLEVKATIHILPKPQEGEDSKDPTVRERFRLLRDNQQSCLPNHLDGVPPDDPIYINADGEITRANFTFFSRSDVTIKFQPELECRKNCDGSDVLECTFDPAIVYIEPYDCANVQADIMNITAPPGDTIVAKLGGVEDEYELVFIKVNEPIAGSPCHQPSPVLSILDITVWDALWKLLEIGNCVIPSWVGPCQVPLPEQDMSCSLDPLLDLSTAATERIFGEVFPCGEGPVGLTVCASSEPPPSGRYVLLIVQFEGDIPLNDETHIYQYAFVFDADGLASNNYEPWPDFPNDFFAYTDKWYELAYSPDGGWQVLVTDVRQNFAQVQSDARFVIAGPELAVFIPLDEFDTDTPTFRTTAFAHTGDFGMSGGPWSGDYYPLVGEPLLPVAGAESVPFKTESQQG